MDKNDIETLNLVQNILLDAYTEFANDEQFKITVRHLGELVLINEPTKINAFRRGMRYILRHAEFNAWASSTPDNQLMYQIDDDTYTSTWTIQRFSELVNQLRIHMITMV